MNRKMKKFCEVLIQDIHNKSRKYQCGAYASTISNVKVNGRALNCCNAHKTVYCQAVTRDDKNPRTSRRLKKLCPSLAALEHDGMYYCSKHLDQINYQEHSNEINNKKYNLSVSTIASSDSALTSTSASSLTST